MAKEVKRHPRAVISPPMTAVTLVDLRRQKAIVTGEISRATPVDIAPSHPETSYEIHQTHTVLLEHFIFYIYFFIFNHHRLQIFLIANWRK